jgi:DNA-binding MarR family transcriptional regulator
MTGPAWLSEREARAWRGYLKMHGLLDLQISRDLARDAGLSDPDYTVLVVLSESADGRMRLVDLAERMLWSSSRLAHHVDRMQRRGLVRREKHPTHSRATVVALTEHGRRVIDEAAPRHVESVRRHFIDQLTAEEIDVVGDVAETVLDHLRHGVARRERGSAPEPGVQELLAGETPEAVAALLAEDVVFHSPVASYVGRADVAHLLATIAGVVADVRAVREFTDRAGRATQFGGRVDGVAVEGMLALRTGADGLVTEATLWLRPLAALRDAVAHVRDALTRAPLPSADTLQALRAGSRSAPG